MHVLSVELDDRGVDVEVEAQRFKEVVGVSALVGPEPGVVMLSHLGCRYEVALLA